MPAQLRPEWLARLRAVDPTADLRWNYLLERWELLLARADGVMQSQFWGWFYRQHLDGRRERIAPDPVTGLYPYRDLDDAAIEEMARNLEQSFIGNRWDGSPSTRHEVEKRIAFNDAKRSRFYKEAGELWADMYLDRLPAMRGTQQVAVGADLVDEHGRSLKERVA